MSKKQAIAFFEEISKNKQLAQEVKKVVEGNNSDEAKDKELISLAKKHNFIFTPEDAQNAQETLKKPLSPEEMLEVSGGKLNLKSSVMAAAMLLGLGATGATLHNMEASAMKRSTPPDGSYSFGGKCGKIDPPNSTQGQTLPGFDELVSGLSNRAPQGQPATTGTQQQTTPQTVGETNSAQRQTPPSNGQGSKPSNSQQTTRRTPHSRPRTTSGEEEHAPRPPKEKKAWAYKEHNKKAAKRFGGVKNCGSRLLHFVRSVASSGALPAEDWPAAPSADLEAEDGVCRFCGGMLSARGEKERDVKCANAGCIYNWVFPPTGDSHLEGNQRGRIDKGHYVRWALLPALILDSRYEFINSTGSSGNGRKRELTIETPAEAWAVWQLIVGHRCSWVNVIEALSEHDVDETTIGIVILLLEESYDNLVLGNESFIDLGSEVQQLVAGYNTGWQQVRTTMEQRGYDAEEAIKRLEQSYNMLTDEQRQQSGLSKEERQQMLEEKRRQEAARRQEEARRQDASRPQVIEKLRRGETSDDEKKAIARYAAQSGLVTCRCKKANDGNGCGSNKISFWQLKPEGIFSFQCNTCKALNGREKGSFFTLRPAALLAMLQEGAPGNAPVEMADAEQDEQQMQFEIQPMQMNHGDGDTFALNFTLPTMLQTSMQGMNQFNPEQQMMMQQNMFAMEMDDADDYEDNFDMGGYGDFDEDDGLPPLTSNRKSKEVKERREDYENQEPYIPEPGMMGYRALQQPMQMMSQNGFGFYLGGQDVNQFYIAQTTQQTFAPNLFNANKEQSFNIQRIPVFQMPTNQNDTQQQNEQIDPLNMNQIHITDPAQPIDQLLEEDQLINDDQNDLVMQQNTPVDQDQQPINDQPGLTFGPTQVFQQLAAQQNVTQPPQNPNENGIIWRFNAENAEDDSLIPGSWKNWGNQ